MSEKGEKSELQDVELGGLADGGHEKKGGSSVIGGEVEVVK